MSDDELASRLAAVLPRHTHGLAIEHNEHRCTHTPLADVLAHEDENDTWVSDEERRKALVGNSVWIAHWYPDTSVSFHRIAAGTLAGLLGALAEYLDD